MVTSPKLTQPFDRHQEFQVLKQFTFNGRPWQPNAVFDKTTVTDRKLRQLYEARYLRMIGEANTFDGVRGPAFDTMSDTGLREWLTVNTGHVPHELATRERLIARAKRRWRELQELEASAANRPAPVGDAAPSPPSPSSTMAPFEVGEKPVDAIDAEFAAAQQPTPLTKPAPASKNEPGRAASKTPPQRRRLAHQTAGASRRDA